MQLPLIVASHPSLFAMRGRAVFVSPPSCHDGLIILTIDLSSLSSAHRYKDLSRSSKSMLSYLQILSPPHVV
jgi:hypothetical protein